MQIKALQGTISNSGFFRDYFKLGPYKGLLQIRAEQDYFKLGPYKGLFQIRFVNRLGSYKGLLQIRPLNETISNLGLIEDDYNLNSCKRLFQIRAL